MSEEPGVYEVDAQCFDPKQLVERVYKLRQVVADASSVLAERRRQWEEQNQTLLNASKALQSDLVQAETDLRSWAVSQYYRTGNKAPGPGVNIRMRTTVEYNDAEALEWAKAHSTCLVLDAKTFEKAAKAGLVDAGVATIVEEPTATIATDLGKALEVGV